MNEMIHPFYAQHRDAMEAAMRHRLDLAEAMLRERARRQGTRLPPLGGSRERRSE